jgi:hypothetical protein
MAASAIEPEPEVELATGPVVREQITELAAREETTELREADRIALATVMSRAAVAVETGAPSGALRDTTDRAHAPAATAGLRARNPGAAVPGAVAVRGVVEAGGAAEDVAGRATLRSQEHTMKLDSTNGNRSRLLWIAVAVTCAFLSASGPSVAGQSAVNRALAAPAQGVKTFATPQQAADALIDAAERFDEAAIAKLFGPEGEMVVLTGEYAQDLQLAREFSAQAREKRSVSVDPKSGSRAFLLVGNEDWPFPVPIVRGSGRWWFDAKAGDKELEYRRIGRNELDAIDICHGYVEAQYEYAFQKRDGYDVNQFAQRIISTSGKQDGLAWQNPDGAWEGPVGERIARAIDQGYTSGEPYHGYFFKVLKGQGPAASHGQMDFVVKGVMIGGFALLAAPAEYGQTGIKTFIVSHDGVVYQKDLGPTTLDEFKRMERFNPDESWVPVSEK